MARRLPTVVAWPRPAMKLAGHGSAPGHQCCPDGSRELLTGGSGLSQARFLSALMRPCHHLASVVSDTLIVIFAVAFDRAVRASSLAGFKNLFFIFSVQQSWV